MKKLIVALLCLALMCAFAAGAETIANPMSQVRTLEEAVEACGCPLVHPAVMGVMDEGYFVIALDDMAIGEYRFSVAGTLYVLRAARTDLFDISGVFINGAPAFEARVDGIAYAADEDMRLARWFVGDAQYVLSAEDGYIPDAETFAGAAEEMAELTGMNDVDEAYLALEGFYQDSVSQRAMLECEATASGVKLTVTWANSAFETIQWVMNAAYNEDGVLAYSDCREAVLSAEDETVVSTDGCGYFTVGEGRLIWDGAQDENCTLCVFEKLIF